MFAELRALLSDAPSEQGFKKVIDLINQWSEPNTFDMAMQYTEEHLKDWPSDARLIRCYDSLHEATLPSCLLARKLVFREHFGMETRWQSPTSEYMANLECLDLLGYWQATGFGFDSPCLGNLKALYISDCHLWDDDMISLANNPCLTNLRLLDISLGYVSRIGIRAIANSPCLRLDVLRMRGSSRWIPTQEDRDMLSMSTSVKSYYMEGWM